MPNFISGARFIRAVIRRLCFGLILVGLDFATHAAQAEDDFLAPKVDPLMIQLAYSNTDLPSYRFSAGLVLPRSAGIAPVGSGFGSVSQFPAVGIPKKEAIFSSLMRVELKGENLKITLRPRSAWIRWQKEFH